MPMFSPRLLVAWVCCVPLVLAAAEPTAHVQQKTEKARIAAERQQANQRFEIERRACEQRFAVTPCLEEARGRRREVLDRLAREQAVLDDAQRRQRAADRLKGIQDRARQLDERGATPPAARTSQRGGRAASAALPHPPASRPEPKATLTPAQAERNRAEHDERLREAEAHREAVARRNADRAAKKPPAAPLPVPSAPARGASR